MTQDRPLLGIGLMLSFCLLAPLGDATAKILGGLVPLGSVLLFRFGVQTLILGPIVLRNRRLRTLAPAMLRIIAFRTVLHIIGIGAMFTALRFLPLADAVAIAFVMPFMLLIFGRLFLNEEIGWPRFLTCCLGFVGSILVIQPSFSQVGWPALLPLVVAVVFSVFLLITRKISRDIDPIELQAISGAMATAFILPLVLIGTFVGWGEVRLVPIEGYALGLLLVIGLLGTLAHLLMTWSLRYAPAATLAPIQYIEIPFATLMGWVIFGDLPNALAALGIAITMTAGLIIVFLEHANAARQKAVLQP